jgi:hypothetical protein
LHYYETPTLLKFILITDAKADNKRVILHQIYVSLYVEFVVKNPLREVEGPIGVETFNLALDQFVRTLAYSSPLYPSILCGLRLMCIKRFQFVILMATLFNISLQLPYYIACLS